MSRDQYRVVVIFRNGLHDKIGTGICRTLQEAEEVKENHKRNYKCDKKSDWSVKRYVILHRSVTDWKSVK